jgi:hypothetical protein
MITFPITICPRCNSRLKKVGGGKSASSKWIGCLECPKINFKSFNLNFIEIINPLQIIEINTHNYNIYYDKRDGLFEISLNEPPDGEQVSIISKISLNDSDLALSELELDKLIASHIIFS